MTAVDPGLIVLLLIAVIVVAVFVEFRRAKHSPVMLEITPKRPDAAEIVVPTEKEIQETFEAFQKGGKEGLLKLFEERKRRQQLAPAEPQNSAEPQEPQIRKPEEPETREIETLPGETYSQFLARISQAPRKEGESRLFKMPGGGFGTTSVFPTPQLTPEQKRPVESELPKPAKEEQRPEG